MKQTIAAIALSILLAPGVLRAQNNFEQQKKFQDQHLAKLEVLPGGKKRIDDIIRVTVKNGLIAATCPLLEGKNPPARGKQYRVDLEGFDRPCTLMMYNNPGVNGINWYVTLSCVSFPENAGMRNLSLNLQPGYFQISQNQNSNNSNFNVQFVQSNGRNMFGQPDGIQFSVYRADNTGRNTRNINFSEPDFDTFRRAHPREMTEFVRPLFRELHLEGIYTVEPIIVWQVFSEQWPQDSKLQSTIQTLLPALNSENYRERQAATTKLIALGPFGALSIYLMPRTGLTTEQQNRLDAVLASFSFLSREQARKARQDHEFLLDSLLSEDARLRQFALDQLQRLSGKKIEFDNKAEKEARVSRISQLRDEFSKPAPKP